MLIYNIPMRTIVTLTEAQAEALARICAREGISRAEAIRRAVDAFARERLPEDRRRGFGIWKDRADDGLGYQHRVRAEWVSGRA